MFIIFYFFVFIYSFLFLSLMFFFCHSLLWLVLCSCNQSLFVNLIRSLVRKLARVKSSSRSHTCDVSKVRCYSPSEC